MTPSQSEILLFLLDHGANASAIQGVQSDAMRLLYGLRSKKLVDKNIFGIWSLTDQGRRMALSLYENKKKPSRSAQEGESRTSRSSLIGEYRPMGVTYVYEHDDGDLHLCLNRRMKGKSALISLHDLISAYQQRSQDPPNYGAFRPRESKKTEQGILVRFDRIMNTRHILLDGKLTIGWINHGAN